MLTYTDWDLEGALARLRAPEFVMHTAPVHPFSTPHDGSHGWAGRTGGRKADKTTRQSEKRARKARRRNRK